MAQKDLIVFIYLAGQRKAVPAGIFSHDFSSEVGTFVYGRRYLQRSEAVAVDPVSLPLGPHPAPVMTNRGLYGAFRDASPDYWGRLVISSELKSSPEALSETDFLMYSNATRVGNLDFRESPDSPEPELCPPSFNQMGDVLRASEAIEAGKSTKKHFLDLLRQGTSMGGARPKCTVEWNDALWIAKFPSRGDSLNIPLIEYATMLLAEKCGITIPQLELQEAQGKSIYLIRRFDRDGSSDAGWARSGFISSLSFMQLDERDRLDWSYPAIAARMRRYCPIADITQFYRRMVFNILVRNTDDHPRNHGFLVTEKGLTLSPAYDIVPSFTQSGVGSDFDLAMSVGQRGREASLDNALSSCEQFGLSVSHAKSIVDDMREAASQWRVLFTDCGATRREIALVKPSIGI